MGNIMFNKDDYEMNNATFLHQASTGLKWAIIPQRCAVTNKWIWLEQAYCATIMNELPQDDPNAGGPAYYRRWFSKPGYVTYLLKA